MFKKLHFHSRVLLCFVGILVFALLGAAAAMYVAADRTSLGLAEQQLKVADRVVLATLNSRDQQLRESTTAVAADFGFREAVASGDTPTIVSALENQGKRLQADVVALVDKAGTVILSTDPDLGQTARPALLEGLQQDRTHNHTPLFVTVDAQLLQIVLVPIRAPDVIGWVCMGFYINDEVVNQIKETAGTEISFLTKRNDSMSVVASTLPAALRASLVDAPGGAAIANHDEESQILRGKNYLTLISRSPFNRSHGFSVAIQLPMATVVAPLMALRRDLVVSGGIITALCLLAAVLSARLLAKPVRALADAARSLSMSKRSSSPSPGLGDDELAHVAQAFHSLVRRAHFDALTGLPNRALFNERLGESLQRAKREKRTLAVVFIDLNGFKAINDDLGHEMGDLVLRKTAKRLARSITAPNTVGRLGGDEFVLILEGVDQREAVKLVEQLTHVVATPMKAPRGAIRVGMSAGIAMFPELALDKESLLKQADAAMYQSKLRKAGPVVAQRGDVPRQKQAVPAQRVATPIDDGTDGDTWAGQWTGKDLSTQRSKVVQIIGHAKHGAQPAEIPKDEAERLRALRSLRILDAPRSPSFDRVTRMTAKALNVPIVLVSLVDEGRQWFLSRVGIDAKETPRDVSFCAHAVFERQPLIVADATKDPRFAGNLLVTDDPCIRAYAGIPIYSSGGYALGTLCAIDRRPRDFKASDVDTLQEFASIIEDLVRAREAKSRPTATTTSR